MQEEWQQQIQAQYFSRWSVDKQDEWQAYQAAFEAQCAAVSAQATNAPTATGAPNWGQSSTLSADQAQRADEYRRRADMQVISAFSGGAVPPPVECFEDGQLPLPVLNEIHQAGFAEPTPIQAQSWPILAAGHDLIGIAKSGSGKTLGFLGPGFAQVLRSTKDAKDGPTVLVLAPTRELARQIQLEALKFGRSSGILCCAVTGGESKGEQL